MFSPQTIADLNAEIAARAAQLGLIPFVPWSLDEVVSKGTQFLSLIPNIGSLDPEGWELVDTVQVDKTGLDRTGPALTAEKTVAWIETQVKENAKRGFAWVEEGQFQIWLGVFQPE